MSASGADRVRWGSAITWGCFLACSWTWVIGMYLPIYLLIDFGLLGSLAFALFNVPGALLVGWIWRRAGQSQQFVRHNEGAMRLFSIATVIFHIGFLGWFLEQRALEYLDDYAPGAVAIGLLMIGAMLLGALGSRTWRGLAVVVMLGSIAAIIATSITSGGEGVGDPRVVIPAHDVFALALASPAIALGFLLCPHLDLTIHRARQESPGRTGTAAFVIGFGVLFLTLIAFTVFYGAGAIGGSWSGYVIAYIAVQSTFTLGAHLRELFELGVVFRAGPAHDQQRGSRRRRSAITAALSTAGLVLAILVGIALVERWLDLGVYEITVRDPDGDPATIRRTRAPRLLYESFLSLYAIVFPAWLWIGVIMGEGLGRKSRFGLWAIALVIAGPLFGYGYIEGQFWLIPVSVAVVIGMGFVASRLSLRGGYLGNRGLPLDTDEM